MYIFLFWILGTYFFNFFSFLKNFLNLVSQLYPKEIRGWELKKIDLKFELKRAFIGYHHFSRFCNVSIRFITNDYWNILSITFNILIYISLYWDI